MAEQHHEDFGAIQHAMQGGGGHANHASSMGGGAPGGHMLPIEGKSIDIGLGSVDQVMSMPNMDGLFGKLNEGGGAFGQTITNQISGAIDHHFAKEAQGEQGVGLENLGKGERVAPPSAQGDLQVKGMGMVGGGGQEH